MSEGSQAASNFKVQSHLALGWRDVVEGIMQVPLAFALANQDMSARYARTMLGPLWGVVGVATMTAAMGLTFGVIFRQPLTEFLPYLAASLAIWNALAGLMVEGPSSFYRHAGIINFYNLPITIQIYRTVIDKLIMMMHALIVYAGLVLIFKINPLPTIGLFPLFILVFIVFGVGLSLILGVLGARFRDLGPAVSSLMLVIFLVTPIFWQKSSIASHPWIATMNPFYHLLEIGRQPLLGHFPTMENWLVAGSTALVVLVVGLITFLSGRRSVFYWM